MSEFILASIHNIPMSFFIITMIGGLLFARLPWIFVAMGGVFVFLIVRAFHMIFKEGLGIQPTDPLGPIFYSSAANDMMCNPIMYFVDPNSPNRMNNPSLWTALTVYFASFIIYNSFRLYSMPTDGKPTEPAQRRVFVTLRSVVVSIVFLFLAMFIRYRSGCENEIGMCLGAALGLSSAIGIWHLIDFCNTRLQGDLMGILQSSAPSFVGQKNPVICHA